MRGRLAVALLYLAVLCSPVLAAEPKAELSFSGTLTNPNDGESSWAFTGEYLFGGHFVAGPSVSIFDTPVGDGSAFGVAGELHTGKKVGLLFGGAIHKLSGDIGKIAEYDASVRAGAEFGKSTAAAKVYAQRLWTRGEDGEVSAPDSTDVIAGVIWRF